MRWYITPEDVEKAESIGVSKRILNQRVKDQGWLIEDAIKTPIRKQVPRGTYAKYSAIAKENGIPYKMLFNRMNKLGWDPMTAATKPIESTEEKRKRMKTQAKNNRRLSKEYIDLAESNGISYHTFRMRVRSGKSLEEAATKPLVYRGQKS